MGLRKPGLSLLGGAQKTYRHAAGKVGAAATSILVMSSSLEENNQGSSEFNLALLLPFMDICPSQYKHLYI